ncbi:MAG: HAD-IA family hydrolase [Clostridiales bacterium]|nr:HAD-IA family hydrolase [Clostridiales bacterium]
MKKIKAIFFDFDDTLQDREKAFEYYCNIFFDEFLPDVCEKERKMKIQQMLDNAEGGYLPREKYFPKMIALWGWENPPEVDTLVYHFNHTFGKYVALFDDVFTVLETLKSRGYKLGIITNGNSVVQNMKLDSAGIRDFFDVILVSGDCPWAKPSREIFDEAAKQIGIENENIVYIGDHPVNDIQGALGADMNAVWMNFGYFKDKCKADVPQIKTLSELIEIFK